MTEDEFISQYLRPLCDLTDTSAIAEDGQLGNALFLNDDAAILTPPPGKDLILSKDMLIEGTHFLGADNPADIAAKALAVNLSDIAAKGAVPAGFMLGLALPVAPSNDWAKSFTSGLAEMITSHNCPLLGGDTTRTPGPLTISITIFGQVPGGKMIRRSTAAPGDLIFTSGTLGDAALGFMALQGSGRCKAWRLTPAQHDQLVARYHRPTPRLELGAMLTRHATAAMDLSDGLVKDLPKLCRASNCSARISLPLIPVSSAAKQALDEDSRTQQTIPLRDHALAWGDDYELLFTVKPEDETATIDAALAAGTPVQKIGTITAANQQNGKNPVIYCDENDRPVTISATGFNHF